MDNGASSYLRFLSGDDSGIDELIRSYSDGLTLYLKTILGDICSAEEAAEEVFVRLYAKKPRFNGKCSFKTWLYSIGRHVAVDYLRKRSRLREAPTDNFYELSDEEDLEKNYIREEQRITLHRAIGRLRSDQAQVLYLTYFEESSTSEIAEIMGMRNRQVTVLLYRAKEALRKELEQEGFEYERL